MILHENTQIQKHVWAVKDEKTWHCCGSGGPRGVHSVFFQSAQTSHGQRPSESEWVSWESAFPVRQTNHQLELGQGVAVPRNKDWFLPTQNSTGSRISAQILTT